MSNHASISERSPFAGSVKRWWGVVAASTLALVAVAPAVAHASPPDHQSPSNATFDIHLTADEVPCGAITITITDGERYTTFSNGVILVTGQLGAVVTSDVTGRSVSLKVSGPGKFFPDGSALGGGPWLIFEPDVLAYMVGRISIPADSATGTTVKGRRVDLCPLLGL